MKINTQVVWAMEIRCLPITRASVKDENIPENIFNNSFYSIYSIEMIFCFSEHQRSNLYTTALREVSQNAKTCVLLVHDQWQQKSKFLLVGKQSLLPMVTCKSWLVMGCHGQCGQWIGEPTEVLDSKSWLMEEEEVLWQIGLRWTKVLQCRRRSLPLQRLTDCFVSDFCSPTKSTSRTSDQTRWRRFCLFF